jgi:erythromycin esterase-like protein
MANTLDDLLQYIEKSREKALQAGGDPSLARKPIKAVIWAHNSHLGDAKYTEFSLRGEKNVGQFVREKYGQESTFNVGFTTHSGTVTGVYFLSSPSFEAQSQD